METDSDSSNTTFDTLEMSDFDTIDASVAPRAIALAAADVDARLSLNIDDSTCVTAMEEGAYVDTQVKTMLVVTAFAALTEPYRLHMNAAKSKEDPIVLHSLVPLLELLSAWKEVDGYFMLAGDITDDDISRLYEYSGKVIEFVYPGTGNNSDAPMVSPDIYLRLSQRIGGAPLLPYLYRLRLLSVSTEMTYLPFLFSSNLTFLEIQNISPAASHLAKSFLAALPYEAPGLQSLEIHSTHQLPAVTLYPIADLKQLRLLELNDVIQIDDFSLLERLSALPHLMRFNFVSHNINSLASLPERVTRIAGFGTLKILRVTGSFMLIQNIVTLVSSKELEVLQLVPVVHLEDYLLDSSERYSSEEELRLLGQVKEEELGIRREREEVMERLRAEVRPHINIEHILRLRQQLIALKKKVSDAEDNLRIAEEARRQRDRRNKDMRIERKMKKLSIINASAAEKEAARNKIEEDKCRANQKKVKLAQAALEPLMNERQTLEMTLQELQVIENTESESASSSLDSFFASSLTGESIVDRTSAMPASQPTGGWPNLLKQTIDFITSQWSDSLQDLTLSLDDRHSSLAASDHVFALPESFFLSFECLHFLELLDIKKWSINNLSSSLPRIVKGWPKIRTLHLPLEHEPGVGLDVLRAIADSCVDLRSLKISINLSSLPPLSEECGASFALRHELNMLSVNSFCGISHGKKGILMIARYLNILFPYLKMDLAPTTNFKETAELWKEVYELVRAFQLVSEDERNRV